MDIKMEEQKTLKYLVESCYLNSKEKGFWDASHNIAEKMMLVVTELAEGVEAYRHGKIKGEKDSLAEELADAVIRICDIAGFLEIDLEKELLEKMEYNKTRPYLHGKNF
jgi:NTP pyrophosphatase (non-canonical NTP hydrolase)